MMYRLVASVGADAPKSTVNPDDEILTVLGGKASCRRKFVINVHLLDEGGSTVNEEFCIIASVAYAHDRSPIVQDENLFLAEPPLLTTFNGVEYPSQDRPTRLVGGKASFKLAISLLSSKYDNRLFCICFTPQFSASSTEFLSSPSCMPPLCEPCYSKPIRSISRKRSSSSASVVPPPPAMSHHVIPPQPDAVAIFSPPGHPKVKSPDSAASEEVEKFFRVSSATSSSEEEDKNNSQNGGDAASDSGSLRYIASNIYKQEAQLLLRGPDAAISGDSFHSLDHDGGFVTRRDHFLSINGGQCEGFLIRRDPLMQFEATHYEGLPHTCFHAVPDMGHHDSFVGKACSHMDTIEHPHHHLYHQCEGYQTKKDALLMADNGMGCPEDSSMEKESLVLIDCNHHHEGIPNRKDTLRATHVEHAGSCYIDSSGRLSKVDVLVNGGHFSPNPVTSQSESTSPISGILASDGSIEHTDAFSKPSPIMTALTSERPVSAPHPGSQLSSPFRPYNPNAGGAASRVSPTIEFQRSSSRSPSYVNSLRRDSPDSLLLLNRATISDQMMQATMASSTCCANKKRLDAVLQRFLAEASMGEHSISAADSTAEDEEQSLLALEVTLQDAIRELEKKKEELRIKRQRLIEDDESRMHNIVFQPSSWVESLGRRYNF